jgi:hypothetical protein
MYYTTFREILGDNVTGGDWAFPVYTQGERNFFVPKITEYFVRSSVNASIGFPYVMVPLFTTEEVLFNRAEANVYLGNTAAVLADLNLFASKTIADYNVAVNTITLTDIKNFYGISDTKSALIQTIMDFKRAAYVQEGMRWFDLMRYKVPVTHITSTGTEMTLEANDLRRVFQIPASAKTSGIALNPR